MSAGGSSSQSSANEFANKDSFIAPIQSAFLGDMFGQAKAQTNPNEARATSINARDTLLPQIDSALTSITGLTNPAAQIEAQTASLQSGLGDLFRNEINPAIQTDAIAAGGFGGGRQGVAEGVATRGLADAFTQGYGDIVAGANQTATSAASLIPGLSDALYQTQMAPTTAAFDPLAAYADILGSPIVLDRARAGQSQSSESGSFEFGLW